MYQPISLKLTNIGSFREQEFVFRRGEAVLLVGENLDDSSQRGNGSGKSMIAEAISLAVTGSSIRDCKERELVRDECEEGRIEFVLQNLSTNSTLRVERTYFSKESKSSTCSIFENGEKVTRSDINEYNKFVLEKLQISKDDFYNYFLITREKYSPFFTTGDVKKKEIINRFSGANKVDSVDSYIQTESDKESVQLFELQNQSRSILSKVELLREQILEEEENISSENIQIQVQSVESEIEQTVIKSDDCTKKHSRLIQEKGILLTNLETFTYSKNFTSLQLDLKGQISEVNKLVSQGSEMLSKCKDKYKGEIEKIKSDELTNTNSLSEQKGLLTEYKDFISTLENKLQGAIECPECHFEFTLRDKGFDVKQSQADLVELVAGREDIEKEIEKLEQYTVDLQSRKDEVNRKILLDQETVKIEINRSNQLIASLQQKLSTLVQEEQGEKRVQLQYNTRLEEIEVEISSVLSLQNTVRNKLQSLRDHLIDIQQVDRTRIDSLNLQITTLLSQQEPLLQQIEECTTKKQKIDQWFTNFKNFRSYLANKSIKDIADFTNFYLQQMGSNISIKLEGYRLLSNKKWKEEITTSVMKDGFDRGSYGKFSAGERCRIIISNVLALQELINIQAQEKGGGLDLLMSDEILDSIDAYGLGLIVESLQLVQKTIMIITQHTTLVQGSVLTIQKKDGVSTIL